MPENYSLKVKLGEAEFSADGPEGTVKDAYQQFLAALANVAPAQVQGQQEQPPPAGDKQEVTSAVLDRAYKQEEDDVVSLRSLPPGDGAQRNADAAILLIYGFHKVLRMEHAPVTKLNEGLRKSGITVKRLDRFIGTHEGLFLKGGARSGGRFSLTNTGEAWAENKLKAMFPSS